MTAKGVEEAKAVLSSWFGLNMIQSNEIKGFQITKKTPVKGE